MCINQVDDFLFFQTQNFVSIYMYPENPEGTRVFTRSMNMGYDIYQTLPGIKLATCVVTRPQWRTLIIDY